MPAMDEGNRIAPIFLSRDRCNAAHGVRHVAGNIASGGRKKRGWQRDHDVSQKKGWVWHGARGTRAMRRMKPPQSGQRAASQGIGA